MNGYTFERRELKYRITDAQRAALEAAFGARMVPDEHGESTICNIYYDTADYRLIRAPLEKPAYKEKLRLRSYGVTEPGVSPRRSCSSSGETKVSGRVPCCRRKALRSTRLLPRTVIR